MGATAPILSGDQVRLGGMSVRGTFTAFMTLNVPLTDYLLHPKQIGLCFLIVAPVCGKVLHGREFCPASG